MIAVREEVANIAQLKSGRATFVAAAEEEEVVEEGAEDAAFVDRVQEELPSEDFNSDFAVAGDEAHSMAAEEARSVRQFSDLEEQVRHLHVEEEAAQEEEVAEEVAVEIAPVAVAEEEVVAAVEQERAGRQFTDEDAIDGQENSLIEEEEVEVAEIAVPLVDPQPVAPLVDPLPQPAAPLADSEPAFVVVVKLDEEEVAALVDEVVASEEEAVDDAPAVVSVEEVPAVISLEKVPAEGVADDVPVVPSEEEKSELMAKIEELEALEDTLEEIEEVSDALRTTDDLMQAAKNIGDVISDVPTAVVEEVVTADDPEVVRGVDEDGEVDHQQQQQQEEEEGETFLSPIIRILRL